MKYFILYVLSTNMLHGQDVLFPVPSYFYLELVARKPLNASDTREHMISYTYAQ